jgi:hypothetical protein
MPEPIDLERFAITLVGIFYQLSKTPELWQWFGFVKPPKRGRFFDRFVPVDRLNRERFLNREILVLCTATALRWLRYHLDATRGTVVSARVLELLTQGPTSTDRWWRIQDFPSQGAALQFYFEALETYVPQQNIKGLSNAFIKRMAAVVDSRTLALWAVGVAQLCTQQISPLSILPAWLDDSFGRASYSGQVVLHDRTLLTDAERLLALVPVAHETP